MPSSLSERLQHVQVSEPTEAGGLQVFGLRWEQEGGLSYVTLDDGLASGLLEVTEVSSGGSVPTLKVTNKGDTMAFLMAGEQLAGGKQNRVLNASIMVGARARSFRCRSAAWSAAAGPIARPSSAAPAARRTATCAA